jgi:hypothetical protein
MTSPSEVDRNPNAVVGIIFYYIPFYFTVVSYKSNYYRDNGLLYMVWISSWFQTRNQYSSI